MKKLFITLCAVFALAACSESNIPEIETPRQNENASSPVTFNITVQQQGDTKARKSDWATGDVIYIMFRDIKTKYLTITYNGSTWTAQAYDGTNAATTFDVADFSPVTWCIATAVHFPVAVDASLNSETGVLTFQKDGDDVKTYYLWQTGADYTLDGANVNLTLTLQKPYHTVMFHIPGIQGNVDDYKLYITKESVNLDYITWRSINSGNPSYEDIINAAVDGFQGVADADGALFAAFVFNGIGLGEAQNYTFTVKSPVQQYTISGSLTLNAGYQYSLPALSSNKWTPKFKFSVSSTKKVFFAPGNLQATTTDNGATWTWNFAAHQYDYIGNATANTDINGVKTVSQNGTVDLFGYVGVSAADANDCYGINNSTDYRDYGVQKSDILKHDWGTLEIGSYPAGTWRSIKTNEIDYLLNTRTVSHTNLPDGTNSSEARFTRATVCGVRGLIIFPDNYNHPNDITVTGSSRSYNASSAFNSFIVSAESDWNKMVDAGAVFLPAAGLREGTTISDAGTYGNYWTGDGYNEYSRSYCWYFNDTYCTYASYERKKGCSVRLVQDL